MPLLKIDKLTMRFGGLTAVSGVDLDVAAGTIDSVIGPNGAGKTTVFNAITGIYVPTEGTILFDGRRLRRPFSWRIIALCAVVGVLSGLAALLISVDINALWRATIKRNLQDPNTPFSTQEAWNDFWGYLHGRLSVERKGANWAVVPWNDQRPVLGLAKRRDDALELAERLDSVMAGDNRLESIAPTDHWRVNASAETLSSLADAGRRQSRVKWIAALAGLLVGAAGAFVVWNRSRLTPDVIASSGIARTFQNIRLFTSMTVLENVQVASDRAAGRAVQRLLLIGLAVAVTRRRPRLDCAAVSLGIEAAGVGRLHPHGRRGSTAKRRDERESARRAFERLSFVGMQAKSGSLAGSLAYGDQRRLEIARRWRSNRDCCCSTSRRPA